MERLPESETKMEGLSSANYLKIKLLIGLFAKAMDVIMQCKLTQ